FTLLDSVDASQTSYSAYGLMPSTSCIFQVTAVNLCGESSASNTQSADSPALPAVPGSVTAGLSAGNAMLGWNGDSSLATAYNIYMSSDGGTTFNYLDSVDASQTSYTTSGLT